MEDFDFKLILAYTDHTALYVNEVLKVILYLTKDMLLLINM